MKAEMFYFQNIFMVCLFTFEEKSCTPLKIAKNRKIGWYEWYPVNRQTETDKLQKFLFSKTLEKMLQIYRTSVKIG